MTSPTPRARSVDFRPLPLLLLLAWGGMACDGGTPPVTQFDITPAQITLLVGEGRQLSAVGAPAAPQWSSSNSQVANVIRETGFVTAIARGTATISAVAGNALATAGVTAEVPPAIGLSAPTVDFATPVGGANPAPQSVNITNAGDRTLSGLAAGSVTYGAGQPTGWLQLNLAGTTAPTTLSLAVDAANLPRGVYTATTSITSSVASNSPQSLAVTLRVQAPPAIGVDPAQVDFATILAGVAQATVNITNVGDLPLTDLQASVALVPPGGPGWLSLTLSSTTAPAQLGLTASAGALPLGTYRATVHISSGLSGVPPVDVPIELTVNPGPSIILSPSSLAFNAVQGTSPSSQSVSISNGGGGSLSDLSVQVTSGGSWLSASLGGPTAPTNVTASVSSASLANGTYNGVIQVSSPVASNSPRTIPVVLTVGPPPTLAVSPTTLTFSSYTGATTSFDPAAQAVQATNSGGGILSGLSASVSYLGGSGWLTASWQSGNTTAPAVLLLKPITGGLARGTYSAVVTVSAPGVASKTVAVTFIVNSFDVDIYPLFSAAGCATAGCHGGTSSPQLNAGASATHSQVAALIVPGNPTNASELICRITGTSCGSLMYSPGLSGASIQKIKDWITAGGSR